ncbi:unnamed protein product [Paramecium pentaurelia]|uniref:Transmembrane protein n=1 Tax=Paramecium pentaurelia TaxID=43138 RepID=A0A8S1UD55_9CILI|nr:unnamed protein product [Paramecium pentaurelia]
MFDLNIFLYQVFVLLICVQSLCTEITNQQECNTNDQCYWSYWKPSLCQSICNLLADENRCNQAVDCKWQADSSSCFVKKCREGKDQNECNLIVACYWINSICWDSSCIQLQAEEAGKCPIAYCIWDEKRKLCYDKKCSDYDNEYDCQQLSFCTWFKYKCIDNGNKKLDF